MKTLYVTQSHDFTLRGTRYLMLVAGSAVFELDRVSVDVVDYVRRNPGAHPDHVMRAVTNGYGPEEVAEAVEELEGLGVLTTSPERIIAPAPGMPSLPIPLQTIVLNLAYSCNLTCGYCFAKGGDYGVGKSFMSLEVAKKGIDFLLENSGDNKEVTVTLFGGEPLMAFNVIVPVVEYGRKAGERFGKRVEFSMTTNGTLLSEEKIRFIAENAIGVSVSMDGPKEVHDKIRTFVGSGKGSYDVILAKVKRLLELHRTKPVAARVTLTRGKHDVKKILTHLLDLGFYEVGIAPVTSSESAYALSADDMEHLLAEFQELSEIYIEKALKHEYFGFSNLTNELQQIHSGVTKPFPCGAALGLLSVSMNGDLYVCHRFTEEKEFKLGSIFDGLNLEKQRTFLEAVHLEKKGEPCKSCWAKFLCAGGCHHESFVREGDFRAPVLHYCDWIRAWTEMCVKTYITLIEKSPEFIENVIATRKEDLN